MILTAEGIILNSAGVCPSDSPSPQIEIIFLPPPVDCKNPAGWSSESVIC
jgi:hypothetical protein